MTSFFKKILILGVCMAFAGRISADSLKEGEESFQKGNYEEAGRSFERWLSGNPPTASVYFNLGQSLLKTEHPPEASLNFRRALMLDPRFKPAQEGLRQTMLDLGLPAPRVSWREEVASLIPLDALVLSGIVLAWLGGFGLMYGIFKSGKRGVWITVSILLLIFGKGAVVVGYLSDPRIMDKNQAVVLTTAGATVSDSPVENATAVAKLPAGSPVWILSQRGRWFYCRTAEGITGWIPTVGVVPVIPTS